MPGSDPVGDMIAMIKNANTRGLKKIDLPHSRLKEGVASVLKREGFVEDVRTVADEKVKVRKRLHIYLKYDVDRKPVMTDIVRISTPGRRVFRPITQFGKVLDGLGILVLSTSKGLLSDKEAKAKKVGGEMVCKVW